MSTRILVLAMGQLSNGEMTIVEGCIQLGPPLLAPDELMDTIAEHIGAAFDRLAEHLEKAG